MAFYLCHLNSQPYKSGDSILVNIMLKKYCGWHKKYFGKELFMGEIPAERDGRTDGICEDCYKLLNKEIIESGENKGGIKGTLYRNPPDAFKEQQL